MKLRLLLAGLTILFTGITLAAQIPGDVMGVHNLGPGSKSSVTGARTDSCAYCHAPHSGLNSGLWNQKLTTQIYTTMYKSTTASNTGTQPVLGSDSNKCLSCHDGTVATMGNIGNTVAYGQISMTGAINPADTLKGNMQASHPFSLTLPLKDNIHLVASLASNGTTADPTHSVKLINGNVECTSCHNPHVQAKDLVSQNFLAKDGSNAQLCLACHDPSRTVGAQVNPLADWPTSAHALATINKISPSALLGSYTTVAADACISCHTPHNGSGAARLTRGQNEQDCIACHNGGSNISPPAPNVFLEYASPKVGHPFPSSTNSHDASEDVLLNNNRHATCVDCHSGHGSQPVGVVFPPAPLIRVSQKDVAGISADGITVLTPAVNQYESCLRCHGTSSGKQSLPMTYGYVPLRAVSAGDSLNLIPQLALGSTSSHPVMHIRNSTLPQPSLLPNMLWLDGATPGRAMGVGTQILCTDCHNSDDNRESGGGGANGPHGSKWTHILERRYEFSTAAPAGGAITTLFPNPDPTPIGSATGPYALCVKCHSLANLLGSTGSWTTHHATHINKGFSCSVCHTAHGMGATSGTISGERLINFDLKVVAPNGGLPVSYNRATNTCVLVCHLEAHNADGTVSPAIRRGPIVKK